MASQALSSARGAATAALAAADADRVQRRAAYDAARAAGEPRAAVAALRADLQLAVGAARSLAAVDRLVTDLT